MANCDPGTDFSISTSHSCKILIVLKFGVYEVDVLSYLASEHQRC